MENRREGVRDRRSQTRWLVLWLTIIATATAVGFLAGEIQLTPPEPSAPDTVLVFQDNEAELTALRLQIESLTPEVRYIEVPVTIEVPVPYEVALAPEIITVYDTTVRIDTVWTSSPPNIIRIPADPRGFWSSETYKPSVGNTVWAIGGGIIGWLLNSAVDNSAQSCIVVNSEETCSFGSTLKLSLTP